jgi:hypothetical protein
MQQEEIEGTHGATLLGALEVGTWLQASSDHWTLESFSVRPFEATSRGRDAKHPLEAIRPVAFRLWQGHESLIYREEGRGAQMVRAKVIVAAPARVRAAARRCALGVQRWPPCSQLHVVQRPGLRRRPHAHHRLSSMWLPIPIQH